ncbi:MAG: biotin--[acetyl-CoA-carboxylase] ligase [Acidimicrobiia bacterium]
MSPPYSVICHEVTDSTQDDARAAFDGTPVLVVAGAQKRGRGRSAAEWQTAPRAMAASLAVRPGWDPADLPLVALLAGVAAGRVIGCELKWPNDVFVDGSKAGGILVEAADGVVVVGFGLNLWWPDAPDTFAAVFADDPGPDRAAEVAEAWASELLGLVDAGPRAWPRDEYRQRSNTLGRDITWSPEGVGRAVDIAADGGLVVVTHEGRTTLHAGQVRHIR